MNNSALGNEGACAVNSFFNRLGYIKPYINSDDTQPVWDGNLFVYNDRQDFTNDRLKFSVPVQVKAHEFDGDCFPETTSYDVEIVNLQNYYIDGGVVFFNVLVGSERNQIYVNYLTKSSIQKLLATAKGSTTRRIRCAKIPRTYSAIVSQLRTLHLQRTHTIIPFEEVKKYKNVQWAIDSYGLEDVSNPLEFITSNPVNILAYIDGCNTPLYVGESSAHISSVSYMEPQEVSINNKVYYSAYGRKVEFNKHIISIGNSLTLTFINSERPRVDVNIELAGNTIQEIIHEIEFILDFFQYKHLVVGGEYNPFDIIVDNETINIFKGKLKFWSDVRDLFQLLHIEEQLINPLNLSKKEVNRINTLIAGLLYGKTVVGKNNINADHLEWISFSNIRVLVFTRYLSDNKYKIVNIFDNISACYKDTDGKYKAASIYSKVIAEDILASNVDWSNLVNSYKEALKENPDFFERANWDVLWLIKTFDKCNRMPVLKAAEDLLAWIMNTDNKTSWSCVWMYNLLQIKVRKGDEISADETQWLLDEEEAIPINLDMDSSQKIFALFSIQILLKNYLRANRLYNKMTEDEKEFIKGLPLFHLYKNLMNQYNAKIENAEP